MESIKKKGLSLARERAGGERPMATGARRRADSGLTAETGYKMISFLTDQPRKEATTRSWLLAFIGAMAYRWLALVFHSCTPTCTFMVAAVLIERPSV